MTKTAFAALILVMLSIAFSVLWFFVPPSTMLFNNGAEREQIQNVAEDSSETSRLSGRDKAAASLDINVNRNSQAKSTSGSPVSANSAPKLARSARDGRPASASPDDEQAAGLAISGLVQDEEGYPLVNIEVLVKPIHIFDADKQEIAPALLEVRSVYTNYDGYYIFADIFDGEYWVYTVAEGGLTSAKITARAGTTSANLTPERQREVLIFGVVKSADGSALEAVQVTSGSPTVITNTGTDGHYDITVNIKTRVEKHVVNFKREGFRDQQMSFDSVDLEGGFNDIVLDVTMEPLTKLTTVTGRLKGPGDRAVVGQVVYLQSRRLKSKYVAHSDNNGLFTVNDVEPGRDYRLLVPPKTEYRDYRKDQLVIPESGLDLQIELEPLGSGGFSGWMVDTEGNQLSGYSLVVYHELSIQQSMLVKSDYAGFFSVDKIPEGPVRLETQSSPRFTITGIRASSKAQEPVDVVLDLGRYVIHGLVTDRRGKPVVSPNVVLSWHYRENAIQSVSSRSTSINANGNFEFAGIGAGQHTVKVKAPGYRAAEITIDVGMDPNNIVVELDEEI